MALFGSKKKKIEEAAPVKADAPSEKPKTSRAKKPAAKKEVVAAKVKAPSSQNLSHIIRQPRITEKASVSAAANIYVFEVAPTATKHTIAAAIHELYGVMPIRVTTTAIPTKKVFARGNWGTKKGGKKAYVYVKKGETIEIV